MNSQSRIQHSNHWLVACQLLDGAVAEQTRIDAGKAGHTLIEHLVKMRALESTQIALSASRYFKLLILDLDAVDHSTLPLTTIDNAFITKYRVIPVRKSRGRLYLAMSDPGNDVGMDEIQFQCPEKLHYVVVEEHKLDTTILVVTGVEDNADSHASRQSSVEYETFTEPQWVPEQPDISEHGIDEPPMMRLVNKLLTDAIRQEASDIHIEPYEKSARIRFRVDGQLREITRPSPPVVKRITARLKVMAKLDLSEKRLPQDGRFRLSTTGGKAFDFRLSTLPALWGEKSVLRVLDQKSSLLDIHSLGFVGEQAMQYLQALEQQQGMVLVTGPTGSGKTHTLYAGLNFLNSGERNISTAEDPVELHLGGINQVAIKPAIGFHFAKALKAFLRQDPDVIMVGEIRDTETAEIAIRAAQTGHLVLSTLHTSNAADTLTRLMDMSIHPYQIASSLTLVLAQLLLRRLCPHCKKSMDLPEQLLIKEGFNPEQLKTLQLFAPVGCKKCHMGYLGRIGVYECLPITPPISRVIIDGGNSTQIADMATKLGLNTLRQSALQKAADGLTSLAEINRIT